MDFTATLNIKFVNMQNEGEVREAVQSIVEPGLVSYARNYGDIMGKPATVLDTAVRVDIPEFEQLDQAILARLISRRMSAEDRQNGVYANRGVSQGSFFLLEGIIRPVLEQFKVNQFFEFFRKSSTGEILVQDSSGMVLKDFEMIPDKVFDLCQYVLSLSSHLSQYREILQPLEEEKMIPLEPGSIGSTLVDVATSSADKISSEDLIAEDIRQQRTMTIETAGAAQEVDMSEYNTEEEW